MLIDNDTQFNLQKIYLDWINNYLTIAVFAEAHGLVESDAEDVIRLGREAHENIVKRRHDMRYDVAYVHMGTGMHNYQVFFESNQIGYALSEDAGYALCEQHHIETLSSLVIKV